jgi:membrane protease YdiL (CAAX protease family)
MSSDPTFSTLPDPGPANGVPGSLTPPVPPSIPPVIPVDAAEAPVVLVVNLDDQPLAELPPPDKPRKALGPIFKRPHPNIWWAFLWTFVWMLAGIAGCVAVIVGVVGVEVISRPNPIERDAYLRELGSGKDLMTSESGSRLMLIAQGAFVLCLAVVGWLFVRLFLGRDWRRQLAVRLPSPTHLLLALLIWPGMYVAVGLLDHFVKEYIKPPSLMGGLESIEVMISQWPWWLAVLVIGLGPGVSEELWCRGFLGQGLIGRYGVLVGVLLTSLIFGLMHVEPRQVIYAPFMGLVLHFVYLTSRSFLLPVLLHTMNNSFAALEACKNQPGAPEVPGLAAFEKAVENQPARMVAVGLLLAGAVAWALYRSRVRMVAELLASGESAGLPDYAIVEHPRPASGRVLVRPPVGWLASTLVLALLIVFVVLVYLSQPV